MKHAVLLVSTMAILAPAPSAMAQFGNGASRRAKDACSQAAIRDAEARYSASSRPRIRNAEARQTSNTEWRVDGSGDFAARRGDLGPFQFSCVYNSRTGSAYSVRLALQNDWGSRPPGGGHYPPGQGGSPERPPVSGSAKGLYVSAAQPNNTVRDKVRSGRTKSYSVVDQSGFTLNVGLRPESGDGVVFYVRDARGRLIFRGDVEGNIYRGRMQGTGGAYRIDVYGPDDGRRGRQATYYLDVALSY